MSHFIIRIANKPWYVMKVSYGITGRFYLTKFLNEAHRFSSWYEAQMAVEEEQMKSSWPLKYRIVETFHVEDTDNEHVANSPQGEVVQDWRLEEQIDKLVGGYLRVLRDKWELQHKVIQLEKTVQVQHDAWKKDAAGEMDKNEILSEKLEDLRVRSYAESRELIRLLADSKEYNSKLKRKLVDCIRDLRSFALLERGQGPIVEDAFIGRARNKAIELIRQLEGVENGQN